MNDVIIRTVLKYLILGLVFVPALMLFVHAKPRPAGSGGDAARPPITHEDLGKRQDAR